MTRWDRISRSMNAWKGDITRASAPEKWNYRIRIHF